MFSVKHQIIKISPYARTVKAKETEALRVKEGEKVAPAKRTTLWSVPRFVCFHPEKWESGGRGE